MEFSTSSANMNGFGSKFKRLTLNCSIVADGQMNSHFESFHLKVSGNIGNKRLSCRVNHWVTECSRYLSECLDWYVHTQTSQRFSLDIQVYQTMVSQWHFNVVTTTRFPLLPSTVTSRYAT